VTSDRGLTFSSPSDTAGGNGFSSPPAALLGAGAGAVIFLTVALFADAALIVGVWLWGLLGDRWLLVAVAAGALFGGWSGWSEPWLFRRRGW